jgi:hypothetical protein
MLPNACLLIEKLGQQTGGGGNKEKSLSRYNNNKQTKASEHKGEE